MRMGLRSLRRMSRRKKEILIRSLTSGTRISIGLIIIQKITLTSIRTMILIHLIHWLPQENTLQQNKPRSQVKTRWKRSRFNSQLSEGPTWVRAPWSMDSLKRTEWSPTTSLGQLVTQWQCPGPSEAVALTWWTRPASNLALELRLRSTQWSVNRCSMPLTTPMS